MITPKQKELIDKLLELTEANKAIWEKHITPKSFIFRVNDVRYIVNSYKTSVNNDVFDCIALNIISNNGKINENCIGCSDVEYIDDYKELKRLYDAVINQYTQNDDKEIGNLLQALPR